MKREKPVEFDVQTEVRTITLDPEPEQKKEPIKIVEKKSVTESREMIMKVEKARKQMALKKELEELKR